MRSLDGASVLLLEDEFVVALDAEQMLQELGVVRVETAATLSDAEARARNQHFDVALLDVNINGRMSFDLAESLRALEDGLLAFAGCAVVISHDRWFLDRVATHILAWEGTDENPASWYWFEGNFESYEKNKIERLGPDAARPHRATYKKLTRG